MAGASSPHRYYRELQKRSDPMNVSSGSLKMYRKILSINSECSGNGVTPLYTLGHLAQVAGVPYRLLDSLLLNVDSNYHEFAIKKKRPPGIRKISAPSDLLSHVQSVILNRSIPGNFVSEHAFAYVRGRGTKDVAQLHFGAQSLVLLDIDDFFGSCRSREVFEVFRNAGYPRLLSLQMCALTTRGMGLSAILSPDIERTGNMLYSVKEGYLPQGAPTSGMLANVLLSQFDVKVNDYINSLGGIYSRYSDDMQFSFPFRIKSGQVDALISRVRTLLGDYSFRIRDSKTKIQRSADALHLLGYSLFEDRISLNKIYKDKVRALIYSIKKYGPESVALKHSKIDKNAILESLEGHYIYVKYSDPEFGKEISNSVFEIFHKFGNFSSESVPTRS